MSRAVTASYNTACLDYFESKGYADRDTTLACVDLRYAPLLERTLDSLFTLASKELEAHYDSWPPTGSTPEPWAGPPRARNTTWWFCRIWPGGWSRSTPSRPICCPELWSGWCR